MRISNRSNNQEQGFTIVELMISLSILSVILVVSTLVMMQIGKLYTKGLNQANLQNAARNINEDIVSAIEFGGNSPVPGNPVVYGPATDQLSVRALCIGNVRYSYILDRKLGTDTSMPIPQQQTRHVLWRDVMPSTSSCVPLDIVSGTPAAGYEMMPNNTRLTRLNVADTPTGSEIYQVDINSAYGDTDLLSVTPLTDPTSPRAPSCNGGAGSQFCAISLLTTQASSRL